MVPAIDGPGVCAGLAERFGLAPETIGEDASFADLQVDSLSLVELGLERIGHRSITSRSSASARCTPWLPGPSALAKPGSP